MAWFVFVATIPAAAVGAAGESVIEKHLGEPWQIAVLLAASAMLLWLDRPSTPRKHGEPRLPRAPDRVGPESGSCTGSVPFGR